jgi:HPt (histidine-containing phosphotransfer) domain-containing protein
MIPIDSDSTIPEINSADLVDWKAFDSLLDITEAWDEPQMMIDLLKQYEFDAQKTLTEAGELGPGSHTDMQRVLHKLKGASGSIAFQEVVTRVRILHDPITSPAEVEKPRLLLEIRKAIAQSLAAVRSRYPWLNVGRV